MLTVTILCFVWRSYPGWSEELLNEPMLCTVRDMEWVACLHDEYKVVTYVEGPQLNFHYFFLREKQAKIFCSKQGHQKIKYQHCRGAVFRFAYSFQRMLLNQQECQVFQTASNTLLHVDLFILSIILWGLNNLEKRIIANNFAMFSLSGFKTLIKYITCSMQRK